MLHRPGRYCFAGQYDWYLVVRGAPAVPLLGIHETYAALHVTGFLVTL